MTKTFSFTARKTAAGAYSVREAGMLPGETFGKVTLCDVDGGSLWVFVPASAHHDMPAIEASESLDQVLADVREAYIYCAELDAEQAEGNFAAERLSGFR